MQFLEFHRWRRVPDFKTEKNGSMTLDGILPRYWKKRMSHREKCSVALIWTVIRWDLINGFKSRRTTLNRTLKSYSFTQHNEALDRVGWSITSSLLGSLNVASFTVNESDPHKFLQQTGLQFNKIKSLDKINVFKLMIMISASPVSA